MGGEEAGNISLRTTEKTRPTETDGRETTDYWG